MAERIDRLLHECVHPARGKPGLVRMVPDEKTARAHLQCVSQRCGFRMAEREVEQTVLDLLHKVSRDEELLELVVEKVNAKLKQDLPKLYGQEKNLKCELAAIRAKADQILEQYAEIQEGATFVKEKLASLEERRQQLEEGLARVTILIEDGRRDAVDVAIARKLFDVIQEVFGEDLKAYHKRALLHYLLSRVEFSDKNVQVGIRADRLIRPPELAEVTGAGVGSTIGCPARFEHTIVGEVVALGVR